ncbi:unnamed protein product [Phaedon cochleariae]|uniref:Beta-galactosidase n=1 Tax=Phaedon cochleariae TaxID=80249 RepID=A0A9P0DAL9_PHACE|nr:unnamed protein product [Phaedon cochleariae]
MATLPTLYEYYTGGGITQGLSANQPYFTLNNRNFTLYGGSTHYWRVPSEYWRDRLRKMRAAGLNTVETYVPWNLHEPEPGKYDFGAGGTDMQDFLDIEKFLKTAQEEDLFVILRPGPYICSEFDFGGLPSWLMREKGIKVRTSDEKFMMHVRRYFTTLLTLLTAFQFTSGGPIIAVQVENEYGNTEDPQGNPPFLPDTVYLHELRQLLVTNNITELLFTSDTPTKHGSVGSLPGLFQTANFNSDPESQFNKLKQLQPGKPSMAMEYWSGWFNHWTEDHYIGDVLNFANVYEAILKYPASVNLYMFHGGTNWGFLNGANMAGSVEQSAYKPDITSYDYDAPLTESGEYTLKYLLVKYLLDKYNPIKTRVPDMPISSRPKAYSSLSLTNFLSFGDIIAKAPHTITSKDLLTMEFLPINNNTGQKFGYIIYRKEFITINKGSLLRIEGYVYDSLNVYVNNKLITRNVVDLEGFGYWILKNGSITLNFDEDLANATIDLVVCNLGRKNFGLLTNFLQYKGIWNGVFLNDLELFDWKIMPLEFTKAWNTNLEGWHKPSSSKSSSIGARLNKFKLFVEDKHDTFIDMSKWHKGIAIVNGFVLGRYWKVGPQQSLYLPAPLLKMGNNDILIFEEFLSNDELTFSDIPIYFNNMTNSF